MGRPLYAAEALRVPGGWLISALAVPGASAEVEHLGDAVDALTPVIARLRQVDAATFDVWVTDVRSLEEAAR